MFRTLLVCTCAAVALTVGAAHAAPSHTIVVKNHAIASVGKFKITGRGGALLAGAIRAFGPPSSAVPRYNHQACAVTWRRAHITGDFGNLGGDDACSPRGGYVNRLVLHTAAWQTTSGLHIGETTQRLRELHPSAILDRGGWWLFQAYTPIGEGGYYPLVVAGASGGVVRSFTLNIGAAGE